MNGRIVHVVVSGDFSDILGGTAAREGGRAFGAAGAARLPAAAARPALGSHILCLGNRNHMYLLSAQHFSNGLIVSQSFARNRSSLG